MANGGENLNQTIKKILTTEVKYVVGIIVFIVGVVAPYYEIKQDIALIKQNHYAHIEAMQKNIETNNANIEKCKETQTSLMKVIAENSVRINILENK